MDLEQSMNSMQSGVSSTSNVTKEDLLNQLDMEMDQDEQLRSSLR